MADFVAKSTVKSAERVLATPFASKAAMNILIRYNLAETHEVFTPYTSEKEILPAVSNIAK